MSPLRGQSRGWGTGLLVRTIFESLSDVRLRKTDDELAALAGPFAVRRDRATMPLDQIAHNGQTEPKPPCAVDRSPGAPGQSGRTPAAASPVRCPCRYHDADNKVTMSSSVRTVIRPRGGVYFAALVRRLATT